MSKRSIDLITNEYYHVYNRGNSKQIIFKDDQDRRRFIKLLGLLNQARRFRVDSVSLESAFSKKDNPLVAIGAYVLMDNHFHILIKQAEDEGITSFLQKVCTAYVMYFNKKYKRTGALFEGPFRSQHVGDDRYMRYLYAYIHLNPAKLADPLWKEKIVNKRKEVVDFIKQYPYSSFHDYCGISRPENAVLASQQFPVYFKNPKDFTDSIISWLSFDQHQA